MPTKPPLLLNLPSPEQLEHFRALASILQRNPDELQATEKEAFRDLILGLTPGVPESWEIAWVEQAFPQEWRKYLEAHWGPPEDSELDGLTQTHAAP
jgi:hypothetical protein